MITPQEFELIIKICDRAEELGVTLTERSVLSMDLEHVHQTLGLRLEDLLASENMHFAHDVMGIQMNINRETGQLEHYFLPRFAKRGE